MTNKAKYAISIFALLLLSCVAALFWLLATPQGAQWIIRLLSEKASIQVSAQKTEGSILKGLRLRDLRIYRPLLKAEIATAYLDLAPVALLRGNLEIKELLIDGLSVQDLSPEKKGPPDLKWPELPGFMRVLDGSINSLSVKGIKYQKLSEAPVEISEISCHVAWYLGMVRIADLVLTSPPAVIKGSLSAGLVTPSLKTDISADLPPGSSAFKRIMFKTDLSRARQPEQVAGNVMLGVIFSSGETAEVVGYAGLTQSSVNLRKLKIKQKEIPGDIIAGGEIVFPEGAPFLRLRTTVSKLDLSGKIYRRTNISGVLVFNGMIEKYGGTFNLTNTGNAMETGSLSGSFKGSSGDISLAAIKGFWLAGEISGGLEISLEEKISSKGHIEARGLNPALISPEWNGTVNGSVNYELNKTGKEPIEGYINGRLLESRLRDRALTGEFKTRLTGGNVILEPLDLHGRGFDLHAAGELKTRIAFMADIRDLSGVVPRTAGSFRSQGWVSYKDGSISFSAGGGGESISAAGASARSLSFKASMGNGKERPLSFRADINKLIYSDFEIPELRVEAKGTVEDHVIAAAFHAPKADLNASVSGSYSSGTWKGKITGMKARDNIGTLVLASPAEIVFSKTGLSVSSLVLSAANYEEIEFSLKMDREPADGLLQARWNRINLAHANQWLSEGAVSGGSSGSLSARWSGGQMQALEGSIEAFGSFKRREQSFSVTNASSRINWNGRGLSASLKLSLAEKGRLIATIASPSTARAGLPETGRIDAEMTEIDPYIFQPFYPAGMSLRGPISGRLNGSFQPGERVDLVMSASIPNGSLELEKGKRKFSAEFRNTSFSAAWSAEKLSGSLDLTLAEYGKVRAEFRVPLPARFPLAIDQKGPVEASVEGGTKVNGILSSLLPGLLEEGKGDLNVNMKVQGQWANPVMSGTASLSNASAYLPQAGIHVNQVKLLAHFDKDTVRIDSFNAESGKGSLQGAAVIRLRDWSPAEYRGSLKGSRFQTVYLPDLKVLADPDLTIEGTPKKMSIRGQVVIPELTAQTGQEPSSVTPSKDVIITDLPASAEKRLPFALDLRVLVTLGEKITVKADGADIQLDGSVEFTAEDLERIQGQGTIKVVKGKYGAYGVNLDIKKGTITFKGPADNPRLAVQAERKTAEVTAGVLVTGTLQKPVVKLYSRPPMSEPDIMSYLVLGHPVQGGTQEVALVAQAAGSLLSKSDSASIQDQLKRRLGLDTLDIESEQEGAFGQKGIFAPETGRQGLFAPAAVAQTEAGVTGAAAVTGQPSAGQEGMGRSLVTIGKYLTPNLYVSFGRSLFTNASLVRLRYKFSKHWEIETQSGTSSTGGDIFYKIQFR